MGPLLSAVACRMKLYMEQMHHYYLQHTMFSHKYSF